MKRRKGFYRFEDIQATVSLPNNKLICYIGDNRLEEILDERDRSIYRKTSSGSKIDGINWKTLLRFLVRKGYLEEVL